MEENEETHNMNTNKKMNEKWRVQLASCSLEHATHSADHTSLSPSSLFKPRPENVLSRTPPHQSRRSTPRTPPNTPPNTQPNHLTHDPTREPCRKWSFQLPVFTFNSQNFGSPPSGATKLQFCKIRIIIRIIMIYLKFEMILQIKIVKNNEICNYNENFSS